MSIPTSTTEQQELQQLYSQRDQISARIASIQAQSDRSQHGVSNPRKHTPRSLSTNESPPMRRRVSFDPSRPEAIQPCRNFSHQSAPGMMRNSSQTSTSSRTGTIPFTATGPVPVPTFTETRPYIEEWFSSQQPNAYTYGQSERRLSRREPELPQVQELGFGEDPDEYLRRTANMAMPQQQQKHGLCVSLPSGQNSGFSINLPSTPTTDQLTNATTITDCDMSRQSSSYEMLRGSIEMMHVKSSCSFLTESSVNEEAYPTQPFMNDLYTGPVTEQPKDMTRCPSAESNASTASSESIKSRSKQQLHKQIQLASRPLAPKAGDIAMSRHASHAMIRIPSAAGIEDKVLAPIPKVPYQRPKHERVFCKKCSDCPEGFRGEHELRRHDDRQHQKRVKKFVCKEPQDLNDDDPRPAIPLSKCKACALHQKKYNAYYNAAAHLRRAHFKPKRRGRGKSAKVQEKEEKRAGKGGGDWPPMEQLKKWWIMVEVEGGEAQLDQDDEESDDECVGINNVTVHGQATSADLETNLIYEQSMLEDFAQQSSFKNVQLDLSIQQCVDPSMQLDPSQSQNFFDPSFLALNDGSPYINVNSFPQSFVNSQAYSLDLNPVPYIGA